jgi:membrane protease YdiL (CAAX protease family)
LQGKARLITSVLAMGLGGFLMVGSIPTLDYFQALAGSVIVAAGFVFMGRGAFRGRGGEYVAMDFAAVVLIGVFFLTLLVVNLGGVLSADQPTINLVSFLIEFELVGVVMMFVSGVLRFRGTLSRAVFDTDFVYIVANFAGFFILDLVIPPSAPILLRQSVSPGSPFVTVMIAIPEETLFRGWLAPWLANVSHTGPLGGSFLSAVLFAVYHLFVYGTSPALLGIVFGAGFITAYTAIKTKVLSITMTSHLVNNFLAVSGVP